MNLYEPVKTFLSAHNVKLIAIDTPVIRGVQEPGDIYDSVLSLIEDNEIKGLASPHTLVDTLSVVHEKGGQRQAVEYENALVKFPNLSFKPINIGVSVRAAEIMAQTHCKLTHAILISLGIEHEANAVLLDEKIDITSFPIKVITLDEIKTNIQTER